MFRTARKCGTPGETACDSYQGIAGLDDPVGGAARPFGRSSKTLIDDVQECLHGQARIEHVDHVLDTEPGLLACLGKSLDGTDQGCVWHIHLTSCARD